MGIYVKKAVWLLICKIKGIIYIPIDIVRFLYGLIRLGSKKDKLFPIVGIIPIIGNNRMEAGNIDRHYYLQDIYMAQKVMKNQPSVHYDIGSRVDGFISHLLCNRVPVTMIDIRPLPISIDGLSFIEGDATDLSQFEDSSIESLSTLHAVEHFGLSRYGDKADAFASYKAMKAVQRVIKRGGFLYFSVPISYRNGIIYNSHRVFKPTYILDQFSEMKLISFAYIHDYKVNEFLGDQAVEVIKQNHFNEYDCGMFVFEKK
ncbi:DUF268 domain-containing protein [Butyrivibrio sp. XBB1001]|uniref:DUF268 domain-containing protein n=1 Tax=Butyrivibrio sp. XBB1001 TaxID=1280682 RepID=UPI000409634A|nr:DUF268 domain-containing protein [Butyrivibrio sp. XBB1001]